jgi:hypothetical protein
LARNEKLGEPMASENFFCVRRDFINEICDIGVNEAVTILVLLCFSDRSNIHTSASTNAVESYSGIGRIRARKFIQELCARQIIVKTNEGTRPQYLIEGNMGGSSDYIFLPKEIIMGAAGSIFTPISQIRLTNDPTLLKVFLNLYYYHYLNEHGGVDRQIFRSVYRSRKVGEHAQLAIWRIDSADKWIYGGKEFELGITGDAFFDCVDKLIRMGLFEVKRQIAESEELDSEIIGMYSSCGDDFEKVIYSLSYGFSEAVQEENTIPMLHRLWDECEVVFAPKTLENLVFIGVLRARFRAKTGLTSSWRAKMEQSNAYWKLFF